MTVIIRKKEKKDCQAVAHVVTVAWNETYKGIVPDWFLEHLKENEEERAENSFNEFDENNNHQFVLEVDNEVVGFVNFGITDDEEYDHCGEIFALYIISKYKGYGFGRKLVEYAKDKVWEESTEVFKNQAYIFGKQYFRISRLNDKVDVVVTDSPILLSSFYSKHDPLRTELDALVTKAFSRFIR